MESIASKLEILKCPREMYPMAYKHIVTLQMVSSEELNEILNFLMEKGIIVPKEGEPLLKPSDYTILANGLEVIKQRVAQMEEIGELDAIKEKPVRINSKGAAERLKYLKDTDEPYKTPEGKYSNIPFSIRKFQSKYGYAEQNEVVNTNENNINELIASNEEIKESTENFTQTIEESFKEEVKEPEVRKGPFDEILAAPQRGNLNDEMFERFDRLSNGIRRVLEKLYGISEVNDNITNNLIKLVVTDTPDDSMVMLESVIYGKVIPEEELNKLKNGIKEELDYTSILDINLGR